jgi:hypothetical protein
VAVCASSAPAVVAGLTITAVGPVVVCVAARPLEVNVVADFGSEVCGNKVVLDRWEPARCGLKSKERATGE